MPTTRTPRRLAAGVASAALVLSGASLLAAPATAAEATAPTIEKITITNEAGGLSGFIPINCTVHVDFTDATPSSGSLYEVRITNELGHVSDIVTWSEADPADPTKLTTSLNCFDFTLGHTHGVKLVEHTIDGDEATVSERKNFTYENTKAPKWVEDNSYKKKGVFMHRVGEKQTLKFSGGEWEKGTKFSTRVWVSKTKEFTPADYAANDTGGMAIVDVQDAAKPVLSWTPKAKHANHWVWVSVVGQAPGKAPWRFSFNPPHFIEPAPTLGKAHVKSFGKKKGKAKVNRSIRVTKPVLTKKGKKAKVKAAYRWQMKKGNKWVAVKGKKGARNVLKLTRKDKGKKYRVRVTVRAPKFSPTVRFYAFPKVKK